jgi:hypothetical protein
MNRLHNIHAGDRAFIVGTGPSLLNEDQSLLAQLNGRVVFGCSRLVNWAEIPFTPMYQVITDRPALDDADNIVIEGVRERFYVSTQKFPIERWTWVERLPNEHYIVSEGIRGMQDEWMPFTNGRSSVLIALQLALWMGVKDICLLGCDTTFVGHVYGLDDTRLEHGVARMVAPYLVARDEMQAQGRMLLDCTIGGGLNDLLGYTPLEVALEHE